MCKIGLTIKKQNGSILLYNSSIAIVLRITMTCDGYLRTDCNDVASVFCVEMTYNIATVNDKSFEGENLSFAVCWVHRGKVSRFFFRHHLHAFMVLQNSYESFNESFAFLTLKLSLACSETDESTLLTHVCADFTFSTEAGLATMQSQEEMS